MHVILATRVPCRAVSRDLREVSCIIQTVEAWEYGSFLAKCLRLKPFTLFFLHTCMHHAHIHTRTAIPKVITLANNLISNPSNQTASNQFILSLREVLESIHQIQNALQSEPLASEPAQLVKEEVQMTSTPMSHVQEKRRVGQKKAQPRYIGSLAATQRRVLPTPPPRKMEGGTQVKN